MSGEEIDRLRAVVNGRVITEGDVRVARGVSAITSIGKVQAALTPEDDFRRLIDRELLRQEFENFPVVNPSPEEIDNRVAVLQRAYAELGGMAALLRWLGLLETELRDYVALGISLDRFSDFRFKPFLVVTPEEIEKYYQERFLPELRKNPGVSIPTLRQVSLAIEEILKEEKLNTTVESWFEEVRNRSRIEIVPEAKTNVSGRP